MRRIQRKRVEGLAMPSNAVYVGRPTRWGNPFVVGIDGTLPRVLFLYKNWLWARIEENPDFLKPLKGKDLVCWCPLGRPCHADIILQVLELSL